MAHQRHARLGADTFHGSSTSLLGTQTRRPALFAKTCGHMELDHSALLKVSSPVSGHTLTVPDGSLGPQHHAAIRDPITGTVLSLDGHARVVTPVLRQPQVYSRNFYLTKGVDIAIATLRATNTVGGNTNEKIGTAGAATGLDGALVTGGRLRCMQAKQQEQQEREQQQEQQQQQQQC